VPKPLVVCRSCRCHVRVSEAACPHCGVDLVAAGATVKPRRRSFEVRRVVFATALAGLSTASCGGRVAADTGGATEGDILGTCTQPTGGAASCLDSCACGPAGFCGLLDQNCQWSTRNLDSCAHACFAKTCGPDQYLDSSGNCDSLSWFTGHVPSGHTCYGAPPFLG
jgi:hypothetical protein